MKRPMKKPSLKYLVADVDQRGNVRFYVRIKGRPKARISEEPFDLHGVIRDAFISAYQRAISGEPTKPHERKLTPLKAGTFYWLLQQYFNSARFHNFDQATQTDKRSVLGRFATAAGPLPYKDMRQEDVERSQAKRTATPGAADKLVKYLLSLIHI